MDPNITPGQGPRSRAGTSGGRPGRVARLWGRTLAAALFLVLLGCLYFFVRSFLKDGLWRFDLTLVNKSLGTTSLLFIALSMLLTGAAYFSRDSARSLAYRKYFGLAGFWAGLAHAAVNHLLLPAVGLTAESGVGNRHAEALGLAALLVFAVMAAASNGGARSRMGGARWRRFLRYAGYAGLVLSAGHVALLKGPSWARYFRTFDPVLPSLSLPVAAVAVAAILLRVGLWVSMRDGKKRPDGPDA